MIDQNMFRAYDIRGTYPDQINIESSTLIGRGFGSYLIKKFDLEHPTVVVGRDCRTHGPEVYKAFIDGLISTGCFVTETGLSPSPLLYFSNCSGQFDAGCNITASHNPKEYNGFKMITKNAHAVCGDELQKLYQLISNNDLIDGEGTVKSDNYEERYFDKIKSIFNYSKSLKIVVDTANGVAGDLYPAILRKLGHEVIELYTELDGTFPNHEPDPIVEKNLVDLKKMVLENNADLGICFDGDGDRIGIVTEEGNFVNSDLLLMLLSKDVLSRYPNRSIIFTVSNSQSLFELVKQWNGKPIMCSVGHSFVEESMVENNSILGGEQSGHFFLPEDYYSYDDALITAARVLKIISDSNKNTSKLFTEFPKTFAEPEIRPYCSDDVKFNVLKGIKEFFKNKYPNITIDGIRMDFGNGGWAGIRVSNTSPRLSITIEAQTNEHLEEIKDVVLGHIKTYEEVEWEK